MARESARAETRKGREIRKMAHTHTWKPDGGCRENPGVFTQGKLMIFQSYCPCGATRKVTSSVAPYDRGEIRVITDAKGKTIRRSTANW